MTLSTPVHFTDFSTGTILSARVSIQASHTEKAADGSCGAVTCTGRLLRKVGGDIWDPGLGCRAMSLLLLCFVFLFVPWMNRKGLIRSLVLDVSLVGPCVPLYGLYVDLSLLNIVSPP